MGKRRMIHDCVWASEGFGTLTMRQRLLWIGLITTADDQGRGRSHPGLVRAAVFPFDVITQDEIDADLQAIAAAGMLILYAADDKALYQIVKWWEYQSPQWAAPSLYLAPPDWLDRCRYHAEGRRIVTLNWHTADGTKVDDKGRGLASQLPRAQEEVKEEVEVEVKRLTSASADYQAIRAVYIECFPDKPQPRATTKAHISKSKTRMQDAAFAEKWAAALRRAGQSSLCHRSGWFDLAFFLKDDLNWEKCLNGNYDDTAAPGRTPQPRRARNYHEMTQAEMDAINAQAAAEQGVT